MSASSPRHASISSVCAISTLLQRTTGTRCGSTTTNAFSPNRYSLARSGYRASPDQALENARACVEAARLTEHKLTLCYALNMAACPLALLTGDLDQAEKAATELADIVRRHSVAFWQALTSCVTGYVMVRQGRFAEGTAVLADALAASDALGGTTWYPEFQGALAKAWPDRAASPTPSPRSNWLSRKWKRRANAGACRSSCVSRVRSWGIHRPAVRLAWLRTALRERSSGTRAGSALLGAASRDEPGAPADDAKPGRRSAAAPGTVYAQFSEGFARETYAQPMPCSPALPPLESEAVLGPASSRPDCNASENS